MSCTAASPGVYWLLMSCGDNCLVWEGELVKYPVHSSLTYELNLYTFFGPNYLQLSFFSFQNSTQTLLRFHSWSVFCNTLSVSCYWCKYCCVDFNFTLEMVGLASSQDVKETKYSCSLETARSRRIKFHLICPSFPGHVASYIKATLECIKMQ